MQHILQIIASRMWLMKYKVTFYLLMMAMLFTELRSLLVNEANWYESKKYCESRGLTLSEVEPGYGPGSMLAAYLGRRYGSIWFLLLMT